MTLFSKSMARATIEDFYPSIAMISAIAAAGTYPGISKNTGMIAMLALLVTAGLAIYQFRNAASLRERSLSNDRSNGPD